MNSKLTGWGAVDEVPKEQLAFSPINTKQRLLSIDMKTQVVQYVERERVSERVLLVPSFCLTFRHF